MSGSFPDPEEAEEFRARPREDAFPDVPYPWSVSMLPVSPKNRAGMRTVDQSRRAGSDRNQSAESRRLIERAGRIIGQLELAAADRPAGMSGASGLAFTESRNTISGSAGIIVRRWFTSGEYSRPLAELLAPSGDLTDSAKVSANHLTFAASAGRLQIYLCEERGESNPRPAVFAAIEKKDDPQRVVLLARLLVSFFEVEQWSDEFIEARADQVQ